MIAWRRLAILINIRGLGPETNDFAPANIGQVKYLFSFDFTLDSDEDGIPDWWETSHGLNPSNSEDASMDPDGDGLSTLQEYLLGTSFQNADSGRGPALGRRGTDVGYESVEQSSGQ